MPIYEYSCRSCGKVSSFFVKAIGTPLEPACSHCQGRDLQRRVSSFALGKTTRSVHEQHPSSKSSDYYRDPRNIGRRVEDSFRRYGVEMPGAVRETIDAAREGHLPKGVDP
jgi:putative FmdB family regulatory protein